MFLNSGVVINAWVLLFFVAIQNIVMDQLVISTNVTSPKDGEPVESQCVSSSVSCTDGSWGNGETSSTLCNCEQKRCTSFGDDRYTCVGNDTAISIINKSFNWSVDNFPLICQCGIYTAHFEYASTLTGATTTQWPVDKTGEIVGGVLGGVIVSIFGVFVCIKCFKNRNHGGEISGSKKEQSGSAGGPQDLPEGRHLLIMNESKSTRESEDRRNSSDKEKIEMSCTTSP